jgi:hypothetical protein
MSRTPTEFRVMASPITGTIYAGRVRLQNGFYTSNSQRHDVTADAIAAVVSHIGVGKSLTLSQDGVPAVRIVIEDLAPLKGCAAARDGDCSHSECPQLRDNEPHATGRHCPLDTHKEED